MAQIPLFNSKEAVKFIKLPNKQFDTMKQIIDDAEKYYDNGEKKVSDNMLTTLIEYIDKYMSMNKE